MHDNIVEKLKKIIWDRFQIDFDKVEKEDYEASLFEPIFGFAAADMLYLFFDVEKAFDIKIPEEDIESNAFSSFNGIAGIVEKQLKQA